MLNPVFSLANMRLLLPEVQPISDILLERLRSQVPDDGGKSHMLVRDPYAHTHTHIGAKEIDILPWIAGGTLQYVGKAVLGISLDTMGPRGNNGYADVIRNIRYATSAHIFLVSMVNVDGQFFAFDSPLALKVLFLRPFVPMVIRNFSPYWRNKLVDWLPFRGLKELREISNILDRSARNIIAEKQADLAQEAGKPTGKLRRDLMTIMRM